MCPDLAKTTPLLQSSFDKKSLFLWRSIFGLVNAKQQQKSRLAMGTTSGQSQIDSVTIFFLDFDFFFNFWARRTFKAKKLFFGVIFSRKPLKFDAVFNTHTTLVYVSRSPCKISLFIISQPNFSTKSEEQLTIDRTKRTMAKPILFLW